MARGVRFTLIVAIAASWTTYVRADEEAEIVTGCHYSNAEWGEQLIDICVKENKRLRAEVLAYSEEHKPYVERCRKRSEFGWGFVKECVDKDIAAAAALKTYPDDAKDAVSACHAEYRANGPAKVKACADALLRERAKPK